MKFWDCLVYLAIISIIAFPIGRVLPKHWFHGDAFPFRCFSFERGGKIYDHLKIRKWKNKLPDMSRIVPQWIPSKNLVGDYRSRLPEMVQETCVAEFIHSLLCIAALHCIKIWSGVGGVVVAMLYFLGNLPFIFIQRYNRPHLMRLLKRHNRRMETEHEEHEMVTEA